MPTANARRFIVNVLQHREFRAPSCASAEIDCIADVMNAVDLPQSPSFAARIPRHKDQRGHGRGDAAPGRKTDRDGCPS
ncbi:hypothetical protein [Burkholderia sp. BCC1993]|uniref:hypothetical protein n=1 Tax=Burkholderia sp. BCC1993 TaxID=2817444 RepID=UPI002AAFAF1C|nr:hypothetical protein [Burkholderia sp. BCC1993]